MADLILGHEPVAALEWEPYCCQVLRERAAEGWFPHLQVFEGDVRLFDPSEYKGRVDIINAGFPCQDISFAGKRAGVGGDTRSGLYREVLRVADVVRPRFLFLENVSAILHNELGTVLGDLAARGYDARWCCLRASDVGANHRRDRWWLLAYAHKERLQGSEPFRAFKENRDLVNAFVGNTGKPVAYPMPARERRDERESEIKEAGDNEPRGWGTWAMWPGSSDFSWWKFEPDVCRVVNGVASRVDRLKALGNGQVPLQAATAFKILMGGLNA